MTVTLFDSDTLKTTLEMASMEEDFPRGGTAKKPTETESKIVVQRTEVDNLFQVEFSFPSFCVHANVTNV